MNLTFTCRPVSISFCHDLSAFGHLKVRWEVGKPQFSGLYLRPPNSENVGVGSPPAWPYFLLSLDVYQLNSMPIFCTY